MAKEKYNHGGISADEHESWSTIRVTTPEGREQGAELLDGLDGLDGLAALIAIREDVGGVETREPGLITEGPDFVASEQPELIVYTTPAQVEAVAAALRAAASTLALDVALELEDHRGDDWRDAWKRHYRPLHFGVGGTTLMIRPSWIERTAGDPQRELILDPGRAFGTGLHESTRLCIELLVERAHACAQGRARAPTRILDLGCGSGILGLAAARLWPSIASLTFADHDPEAVATARENAELNAHVGLEPATLDFRTLRLGPEPALEPAELVLANIRPEVLIPAAPALTAMTAPGGVLILSGILDEEAKEVLAAYTELERCKQRSEGGWIALCFERRVERAVP